MSEPHKCSRGHVLPEGKAICKQCIRDGFVTALMARFGGARLGKKCFAVRAIEKSEVVEHAITNADTMNAVGTGHLVFSTADGQCMRVYAPGTWLAARDVSAEGPEAVAAFLAEQQGAGTA